jgi:hypothetical protein
MPIANAAWQRSKIALGFQPGYFILAVEPSERPFEQLLERPLAVQND